MPFRTLLARLVLPFLALLLLGSVPFVARAQCLTAGPGAQQGQNEGFAAQMGKESTAVWRKDYIGAARAE